MKRFLVVWLGIVLLASIIGFGIGNASQPVATGGVNAPVVQQYGQLKVIKGQLCDQNGNPIQLRGVSSSGLQWFPFSSNTIRNLVKDWQISVVRAAMYTEGYHGYTTNSDGLVQVKSVVKQAINSGIYVIVDWHILSDPDPNTYKNQAKTFFENIAKTYGDKPNILYEICNEPNRRPDGTMVSWDEIKSYANFIIPAIRAIDPNNIIIVGTDTWSQGVDNAAADPLTGANIMYTLHFYAGTHRQSLRDRASAALAKGLPIFVTEWGTTDASGDGPLYLTEAQTWIDWMNQHKISWVNWSFCNKSEGSAILKSFAGMNGPWKDSQLTDSGKWVKSKISGD